MPWTKRACQSDEPSEVSRLIIKKATLSTVVEPDACHNIDLRNVVDRDRPRDAQIRNFGTQLQEVGNNSCCLQALSSPHFPQSNGEDWARSCLYATSTTYQKKFTAMSSYLLMTRRFLPTQQILTSFRGTLTNGITGQKLGN